MNTNIKILLISLLIFISGCNSESVNNSSPENDNGKAPGDQIDDVVVEDPDFITVTFMNTENEIIKTEKILPGSNANPPEDFNKLGYSFIEWNGEIDKIQEDVTFRPIVEKIFDYKLVNFIHKDGPAKIYPDRDRENTFFAVFRNQFVGDDRAGIYRTTNDGESWKLIVPDVTPAQIITAAKNNNYYVYAAGLENYSIGKSDNGGDTWAWLEHETSNGFSTYVSKLKDLTVSHSDPLTLVAIDTNLAHQFVMRSTDGGVTWTDIIKWPGFRNSLVQSSSGDILLISNNLYDDSESNYIMKSTDDGLSYFQSANGLRLAQWPTFPNRNSLFLHEDLYTTAGYKRIYSVNAGASWSFDNNCTLEFCDFRRSSVTGGGGPGLNNVTMKGKWYSCDLVGSAFGDEGLRLLMSKDSTGGNFEEISHLPFDTCILRDTNYNALVLGTHNTVAVITFEL